MGNLLLYCRPAATEYIPAYRHRLDHILTSKSRSRFDGDEPDDGRRLQDDENADDGGGPTGSTRSRSECGLRCRRAGRLSANCGDARSTRPSTTCGDPAFSRTPASFDRRKFAGTPATSSGDPTAPRASANARDAAASSKVVRSHSRCGRRETNHRETVGRKKSLKGGHKVQVGDEAI